MDELKQGLVSGKRDVGLFDFAAEGLSRKPVPLVSLRLFSFAPVLFETDSAPYGSAIFISINYWRCPLSQEATMF